MLKYLFTGLTVTQKRSFVVVWRQRPGLLKTENQLGSQIVTVLFNTLHAFIGFYLSEFS